MASLAEKLDILTLQDESMRKDLFGYLTRVKKTRNKEIMVSERQITQDFYSKKRI